MIPGEPPFRFPWPARLAAWFYSIRPVVLTREQAADLWDSGYEDGRNDAYRQLGSGTLIDPTPNPYWED